MRSIVRIDGGLGSQLIGWMLYQVRFEKDKRTRPDVSYFDNSKVQNFRECHPARRPWELHRYGIELSAVRQISRRQHLLHRGYESAAKQNRDYITEVVTRDWSRVFPLLPEAEALLNGSLNLALKPFAAIHIRRGDFLTFASKIVPLSQTLELCTSIARLLPPSLVFLSDEVFLPDEISVIKQSLPRFETQFLDNEDPHVCHGVMRLSDVLITSNSTFSWSASLMRVNSNALTFSPTSFTHPAQNISNEIYRAASEWMLIG